MIRIYVVVLLLFVASANFAQEKRVGSVKFEGTKRIKADFLLQLVSMHSGSVLDTLVLNHDVQKLQRLPTIANVKFKVISKAKEFHVIYSIDENFTLIPYANVFTSSDDDFAFRIGLQEFNLLGRNITLGGFYQYDNYNSYGLSLRAPYLFSSKLGLAINYHDITTREPVFLGSETSDYRYNNKAIEVLGLYEFNFSNRVELGFSTFTEDYSYLFGATSSMVPQELNVDKYLFKLIYDYNNLSYFYQYIEGFRSMLNFQFVGTSNDNLPAFLIGFNDFTYFKRLGVKGNWATRLRLGLASNINTPFAPFTVDNNVNIRGVGNAIDRGTGAIVFNIEYRYTLVDKNWFVLQSNVFLDGGSWRNPGGSLGDFAESHNVRIYPGVGLRFMHKKIFNAIFRIDYGYGISKNPSRGVVFGIGQYF